MAQSVERVSHNHEVVSSILTTPIFLPNRKQNDRGEKGLLFCMKGRGYTTKEGNDNNNDNNNNKREPRGRKKYQIKRTKQNKTRENNNCTMY